MSVLNRSLFAKSYAQGGLVEESDDTPTAKGYLQSKGIPVTPASLARATDLLTQASGMQDSGAVTSPVRPADPIAKRGVRVLDDLQSIKDSYDAQGIAGTVKDLMNQSEELTNEEKSKRWLEAERKKQKEGTYKPESKSTTFEEWLTTPEGGLETKDTFDNIGSDLAEGGELAVKGILGTIKEGRKTGETSSTFIEDTAPTKDFMTKSPAPVDPKNTQQATQQAIDNITRDIVNPTSAKAKEEMTNIRSLAKELNVDLGDPYDSWAYIRDMSAGLLASNDNTFLGALGDAALLSNKNRGTAEAAHKELKTKLAIAKWRNEEDWAKLQYKTEAEIRANKLKAAKPFKLGSTLAKRDNRGSSQELKAIDYGLDSVDPAVVVNHNGINAMWVNSNEQQELDDHRDKLMTRYETDLNAFMNKQENIDRMMKSVAATQTKDGEAILRIENEEDIIEARSELAKSTVDELKTLGKLYDDEEYQQAADFSRSLADKYTLAATMNKALESGPYGVMNEARKGQLMNAFTNYMQDKTNDMTFDPKQNKIRLTGRDVDNAMREFLPNVDWSNPTEGAFNNAAYITREARKNVDWVEDTVTRDNIFKVPMDFITGSKILDSRTKLHRKDELESMNKSQWRLLEEQDKSRFRTDMMTNVSDLSKETGLPAKALTEDMWNNILKYSRIRGGEDVSEINRVLGWNYGDVASYYHPFKKWIIEPPKLRQQARDEGYEWDSQKGYWYDPNNESDIRRYTSGSLDTYEFR